MRKINNRLLQSITLRVPMQLANYLTASAKRKRISRNDEIVRRLQCSADNDFAPSPIMIVKKWIAKTKEEQNK